MDEGEGGDGFVGIVGPFFCGVDVSACCSFVEILLDEIGVVALDGGPGYCET